MSDDDMISPDAQKEPKPDSDSQDATAPAAKLSRLDRLHRKLKKLQGKDPDIYPMW